MSFGVANPMRGFFSPQSRQRRSKITDKINDERHRIARNKTEITPKLGRTSASELLEHREV
jgi:hypothetical protein